MTQRKPPGVTWETWIDRQIRVGMESGAFDDLPGTGRPVPDLDRPRDEMWWVRDKVRREGVTSVPPAVAVRRELDATVVAIAEATNEAIGRARSGSARDAHATAALQAQSRVTMPLPRQRGLT
jgi:hypothetical protein